MGGQGPSRDALSLTGLRDEPLGQGGRFFERREGDTFTLSELRTWLEAAGFQSVETLEAPAPSPLIVARAAA